MSVRTRRAAAHAHAPTPVEASPGKAETTRRHVLDCALAIVRADGAPGLTTRRIADVAAVSVGTVFYAFRNLDGLVACVKEGILALLHADLARAATRTAGQPPAERLLALADAYMAFSERETPAWTALFEHPSGTDPEAVLARSAAVFSLLEGILAGLPGVPPEDRPVMARALWSSVHGIVFLGRRGALGPVKDGAIRLTVRALVRAAVEGLSHEGFRATREP